MPYDLIPGHPLDVVLVFLAAAPFVVDDRELAGLVAVVAVGGAADEIDGVSDTEVGERMGKVVEGAAGILARKRKHRSLCAALLQGRVRIPIGGDSPRAERQEPLELRHRQCSWSG